MYVGLNMITVAVWSESDTSCTSTAVNWKHGPITSWCGRNLVEPTRIADGARAQKGGAFARCEDPDGSADVSMIPITSPLMLPAT